MKFFDELNKLNLSKNKFAIFGSGPLAIKNLKEINDLNIIADKKLWSDLLKKYET